MAVFPDKYQTFKNFTSTYKEIRSIKKNTIYHGYEDHEKENGDCEEEQLEEIL